MHNEVKFECDNITKTFLLDEDDKDKYLVVCIAKDENDYIIEWIEHYLRLGFDKIIIGDNNDDDSMTELLKDYINKGTVQLLDCHGFKTAQIGFCNLFAQKGNYKWCAFFDCDEFLEITDYHPDIKWFLNDIEGDCLCVNWITYGFDGHYKKGNEPLQERFVNPIGDINTMSGNMFIKCVVKGSQKATFNGQMHFPNINNKYNLGGLEIVDNVGMHVFPPKFKKVYLKHYYSKSLEEYIKKINRGYADGSWSKITFDKIPILKEKHNSLSEEDITFLFWGELTKISDIDNYDVIFFDNNSKDYYNTLKAIYSTIKYQTNKTLILPIDIDDAIYNHILNKVIGTSNKLVSCENNINKLWWTYQKYNKQSDTYYICKW